MEPAHALRGETRRERQCYPDENLNESRFILSLLQISGDGVDLHVGKAIPANSSSELLY